MKRLSLTILFSALVASASAQTLDNAQVQAAITAGESGKAKDLMSDCTAHPVSVGQALSAGLSNNLVRADGAYDAIVTSNAGEIALLAAAGKRAYKPLVPDAVPAELREPAVFVTVEPHDSVIAGNAVSVAADITNVVLKSKSQPDQFAKPVTLEPQLFQQPNSIGYLSRMVARLDLAAVRNLPAGDLDIVVVTPSGERRCKMGSKDRAKLGL